MRHTIRTTIAMLSTSIALPLHAQTRAPIYRPGALNTNQQLAHDIYKELIEINTGMKTGNVTPAADFRNAG